MYSNSYQPTFEMSSVPHLSPSELEFNHCLNNYQRHDSMDYSRRTSYFTGLLGNPTSESSYSDHEQQTPSPFSVYEDYQNSNSFDTSNKHQTNHLVDLSSHQSYQNGYIQNDYTSLVTPWLTSVNNTHERCSSPMIYANPAIDMYSSPQAYLTSPSFDQNHYHPLCSPMNPSSLNLSSDSNLFCERTSSSSSSCSSTANDTSANLNIVNSRTIRRGIKSSNTKINGNNTGKPTRSRGRRVSSSPSVAGQKMFKCDHDNCGKAFKRSEHLKRHVRSIHTLEKPYECPYHNCSKSFSRSDNLNQHIRIHRHTGKDKNSNNTNINTNSSVNRSSFSNYIPNY
ncbi:hypothetical protein BDB01DRAFT_713925 [Pilobolus umbonatus]|nr:hypothetical protein BDB01DRAFT_713925 [Pilobolus umbonatus]